MKRLVTLLAAAAVGSTLTIKTAIADEVLTAVHAFPPFLVYTKTFLEYVDAVNERGAGVVQINGHVAAAGFEITDHRHPLTNPFEVIDAQVDAGGAGNGQQVQHRIGGATHRHDHADRILKGFLREQIQRTDIGLNGFHQHLG